ncbi:2-hydroxyacid dehydrogenase [Rhizobium laguerreae]|uniref:2-hydroxyacid dehydrogenase n=1 Tax=Rhizobium laguerreae TaxID=1076926 RepID=UPI001FED051B|nr:2-hydroxyacid dehydrogenase [Rhizobium laguerreae]
MADLIIADPVPDDVRATLAAHFSLFSLRAAGMDARELPERARSSRFILSGSDSQGNLTIDSALIEQLPRLELIANFGVGYDRIDTTAAKARGVVVTNTPSAHDDEVADFAVGLLIATLREIPQADAYVRAGKWLEGPYPLSRGTLRGRKLGIVGLGSIGSAFALRAASFGVSIAYHNRKSRPDVHYDYYGSIEELSEAVDTMVVTVPGGDSTRHLINDATLQRLGPSGVLINLSRGSVVDERALITALSERRILAAGLDVYSSEPRVAPELMTLRNVVLQPHIASASVHTRAAMWRIAVDNLLAWRSGRGPISPVPETPWPPRQFTTCNPASASTEEIDHERHTSAEYCKRPDRPAVRLDREEARERSASTS